MTEFLYAAASVILLMVVVGLGRLLLGPRDADRMMAAQLLGTGTIAVLLLAAGGGLPGAMDMALVLALLAAFLPVIFSGGGRTPEDSEDEES